MLIRKQQANDFKNKSYQKIKYSRKINQQQQKKVKHMMKSKNQRHAE